MKIIRSNFPEPGSSITGPTFKTVSLFIFKRLINIGQLLLWVSPTSLQKLRDFQEEYLFPYLAKVNGDSHLDSDSNRRDTVVSNF